MDPAKVAAKVAAGQEAWLAFRAVHKTWMDGSSDIATYFALSFFPPDISFGELMLRKDWQLWSLTSARKLVRAGLLRRLDVLPDHSQYVWNREATYVRLDSDFWKVWRTCAEGLMAVSTEPSEAHTVQEAERATRACAADLVGMLAGLEPEVDDEPF